MSLLESVLGNKALVNAALGQIKKIIKAENLDFIVIRVDPETDEIILGLYKPGEALLTVIEKDEIPLIEQPVKPEANAND